MIEENNKLIAELSEPTFVLSEVRLIATRFAHQSRLKGNATNNDTINTFDEWFKVENFITTPDNFSHGIDAAIKVLEQNLKDSTECESYEKDAELLKIHSNVSEQLRICINQLTKLKK